MLAAPSSETDPSEETGRERTPPPRRAGKYYILAELGRGGTATVYLAVARGVGGVSKLVVLKALLPEFADETSAMSSFLDEARLAVQLNHPNVVQTYEVGTEADHSVIVMEYLEGQSLSRITRYCDAIGHPLPDGMHLKILIELLAGLHYSHELKSYEGRPLDLVHRDVSPQNVFVTYDGQVKVLDFGIAKARTSLTHTATGVLKGKISYMSSEQMAGGTVDRRADVFSVGCMLWAAAAGRKLWKDYSYVQIVRLVLAGKIPSPKQVNPHCPEELEHIVMKALAPNRDDRYSTALEFQEALEAFTEKAGLVVKQREIGALVSHLFATTRAELKAKVERELATMLPNEPLEADRIRFGPEELVFASGTKSQVRELSASRITRRQRGPFLAFSIALVIGVSVSALAWRVHRASESPRAVAASPNSTPSVATARPAEPNAALPTPTIVRLALAVVPHTALLTLDGRALEPGTKELPLPEGLEVHALAANADGYEGTTLNFQVRRAETLRIALKPKLLPRKKTAFSNPLRDEAAPASSPPISEPPAEPGPAPVQVRRCQNPFLLDSEGIKHVRPECF